VSGEGVGGLTTCRRVKCGRKQTDGKERRRKTLQTVEGGPFYRWEGAPHLWELPTIEEDSIIKPRSGRKTIARSFAVTLSRTPSIFSSLPDPSGALAPSPIQTLTRCPPTMTMQHPQVQPYIRRADP
jgi:hypothetical protein